MLNNVHNCPKSYPSEHGVGVMVHNPYISCWVCEGITRAKYSEFMPMIQRLREYHETGDDTLTQDDWQMLYGYFFAELDYGIITGDTGTIDEWLCDRPEHVSDLIGNIEGWCTEEVAS